MTNKRKVRSRQAGAKLAAIPMGVDPHTLVDSPDLTDEQRAYLNKARRQLVEVSVANMTELLVNRGGMDPMSALKLIESVAKNLQGNIIFGAAPSDLPGAEVAAVGTLPITVEASDGE